MSELGRLLRQLRGKESLRDISRKAGLSHTYLNIIEKRRRPAVRKSHQAYSRNAPHFIPNIRVPL